ncbi:MAG: LemA family protein [Piscinibacter sp.]|nr:LemA family protein [Piscinibacter sp.]
MDVSTIVVGGVAAVLLFWCVGAYNRLVRLRATVSRRFVTVDQQCEARAALLQRQCEALAAGDPEAATAGQRLRAASAQADAARSHARARPTAPDTLTSLRLAEDILADARRRVAEPAADDVAAQTLRGEFAAVDTTLDFARRQFNDAAQQYNRAVGQFPTWLIAGPFGFHSVGLL